MIHRVLQAFAAVPIVVSLALTVPGCDKAKEGDCKEAIENIIRIYKGNAEGVGINPQSAIRTCRGSASPQSVKCFIEAKSVEDLDKCEGDVYETVRKERVEREKAATEKGESDGESGGSE